MPSVVAKENDGMVVIDAGSYTPLFKLKNGLKEIQVNAFLFDIFSVTNQEYSLFADKNVRWSKSGIKPIFADPNYLSHMADKGSLEKIGNQPVTNISWSAFFKLVVA